MTALLVDALTELGQVEAIRVRHRLGPAAMRLMGTLGVEVVVDLDAPECEHYSASWNNRDARLRCARCEAVEAARERVS